MAVLLNAVSLVIGDARNCYEEALVVLKLNDRNDPLTETVAKFIVEAAQTGAKDPEMICTLALSRMGGTDREAC